MFSCDEKVMSYKNQGVYSVLLSLFNPGSGSQCCILNKVSDGSHAWIKFLSSPSEWHHEATFSIGKVFST